MSEQIPQSPKKSTKGYGKHSLRYWIVLYLVVAIVVYGIIYLLFIHKNGSNSGGLNY
jgi:hypothetical protein